MSRVEAVLKGAKATVISREKKENRELWIVEGLVHPGLKRTLFTFKSGALFGVELQYEYPDWSIERYNERMGEIRRYFDAKYGTGKLVSRTRDRRLSMFRAASGFFLQTLELARQTYLGRCAHSIDEKNPVEMIDLVLNRPRQKPGRFDLDRFTIYILGPHRDRFCPSNFACDFRKAQTTFGPLFGFSAQINLVIDQDQWRRGFWIDALAVQFHRTRPILDLRNVEHRELKRLADLRCG